MGGPLVRIAIAIDYGKTYIKYNGALPKKRWRLPRGRGDGKNYWRPEVKIVYKSRVKIPYGRHRSTQRVTHSQGITGYIRFLFSTWAARDQCYKRFRRLIVRGAARVECHLLIAVGIAQFAPNISFARFVYYRPHVTSGQ